jgi:predicted nucleic acid-binding protein
MTFSSCLTDEDSELVLDSSVVINLLATECPNEILRALALPIVVTDNVVREIERGVARDRQELDLLARMIGDQVVRVTHLEGETVETFFKLVSGSAAESLGDGEAATLAFAQKFGHSAAIDERKARRLSADRFPTLRVVTTIDILAHANVRDALGKSALSHATFSALRVARMQVRNYQFDWVQELIGQENVAACTSLRRFVRVQTQRGNSRPR